MGVMMKISKVIVSEKLARKLMLYKNTYNIHKLVYSLVGSDCRPLYSYSNTNGKLSILIKHGTTINPREGISIHTKEYACPSQGQYVIFDVTVNPTRRLTDPNGKKKRVLVEDPEQWFLDKDIGLDIHSLECEYAGLIPLKGNMKVNVFRLAGRAIVKDESKLKAAIYNGLGRGKSFGAGLLQVWTRS